MAVQSLIRWILPREDRFYNLMEQQAVMIHQASRALSRFDARGPGLAEILQEVETIEHDGDDIFRQIENALAQTFVTPIDREDIHLLSSRLDDVLDLTKLTAQTYSLYGLEAPSAAMSKQMELLVGATEILRDTLPALRKHEYARILTACRNVFQYEKEGDGVFRAAVGDLFRDPKIDAKELLREKEILEDLEQAINRCENVADVLSNLAVKHG